MTEINVGKGELLHTPLHKLHAAHGAKFVPFAGYSMPIQYEMGILREHLHTRDAAGIFDVSHMGQIKISPHSGNVVDAALMLERLVPADIFSLPEGRQRYALLLNESGGILDDLMVAKLPDHLIVIVNAATKSNDLAIFQEALSETCAVEPLEDRALIAIQGPKAELVLERFVPEVTSMAFMDVRSVLYLDQFLFISRSGYTGEDGFEISVPNQMVESFVEALLDVPEAKLIGLGARDSLRLEAGLCLYGTDIDETTTPGSASLEWSIQKSRRLGGARGGGFPGAHSVLAEIADGTATKRRVGVSPLGRAPIRNGSQLYANEMDDVAVGRICSGAFGPSAARPVAMGYVNIDYAKPDTKIFADVRGVRLPVIVSALPFVPHRFKRN